MKKHLHVAVGVIQNKHGQVLIAKRPETAHQGGLWEFPGGKVDASESLQQALFRELKEELAIDIIESEPLIQIRHDYSDKSVFLDVHKVTAFSGEAKGNEGQPIQWIEPSQLGDFEFPAANRPIIKAINLPRQMAITGSFDSLADFEKKFTRLVDAGTKFIQLRISNFLSDLHAPCLHLASRLCHQRSINLQFNIGFDNYLAVYASLNAGLHLKSTELMRLERRPVSEKILLGASCHSLEELAQAEKIAVDYVLLSPVSFTQSHPDAHVLGWDKFQSMVESINVPVFALGGMTLSDLPTAINRGAQGIAGIGEWWN